MKNIRLLFVIAFICYFIGHLFWSINMFLDTELINEWYINLPFGLFSLIGLIASINLYNYKK